VIYRSPWRHKPDHEYPQDMNAAEETIQLTPEQREADLAKLRELFGAPDPDMLALVEQRDAEFEARLAAHAE
jgi:hypothetical protein